MDTNSFVQLISNILDSKIYQSIGQPILTFILGIIIISIILNILKVFLKKSRFDPVIYMFALNSVKVISIILLIIIILENEGIDTKSIITVFGLSGAAIALSLRDALSNIVGGIVLIFTQPFKSGDFVKIGNTEGRIEHIDLILTTLTTPDNKIVTVPNGLITNSVVVNYSKSQPISIDIKTKK